MGNIRGMLRQSTRIGETQDDNGEPCVLYAYGRTAIYLTPDLQKVKTVLKHESITYDPIKQKVRELHAKEIRKLNRTIAARKRRLIEVKCDAKIEASMLEKRIFKSRSEAVREASKARIEALNQYIKEMEMEIDCMEATKKQISKSMVAVI